MAKNKRGRPAGYNGKSNHSAIGSFLGSARVAKGMTLAQVAERLGVTVQFVSNVEHGRAPLPARHVAKLAVALGVPASTVSHLALTQTRAYRDLVSLS